MSRPDLATVAEMFSGLYDIVEPMPWNGLAPTYKAVKDGHPVVLALLPIDAEGSKAAAVFSARAGALVGLVHPRLLSVTAESIRHGVPYLELPHIEGETLDRIVARVPLHRTRAVTIARRILRALELLEAVDILHLDLTPSNILVAGEDDVRVMGAGVASILREVRDTDKTGPTGKGSGPSAGRFLAPELLVGDKIDSRSDIYSVGALLHFMLTGFPIGKGGQAPPADLATIIAKATQSSRTARYPRAVAMRTAIEATGAPLSVAPPPLPTRASEGPPVASDPPIVADPPPPASNAPTARRRPALLVSIAAVAAASLLAIGVMLMRDTWDASSATASASPDPTPASHRAPAPEPAPEPEPEAGSILDPDPVLYEAPDPDPTHEHSPRIDLLAGDLPEPLDVLLASVSAGEELSLRERHLAGRYASANRSDPRAHLLLARDFMTRGWSSDAITEYRAAFGADSECHTDTKMRDDLLELSSRQRSGPAAAILVARVYGRDALPNVEAMLEGDLEVMKRRRFEQLQRRLSGL